MGFAAYARAFMRQNPDVILIGEIRDEETADVALRAAHTGHLVLSTLHANDGVRTVSRLLTLGVDPSILAGSLLGALAQRLARRLCAECRRETPPPADLRRQLLLADDDRGPYFEAPGCRACGGDGYRGRVGLFELFVVDEEAADLIVAGRPVHELRRHALGHGMTSLLQDALRKARAGATSLAEIARVVPYRIIAADREP
jgi:type II secretory ATPase GspE/PulE/Tfp pilus assembly ATPase PilB-like protein